MKILDLGCGNNKRKEAVGIDREDRPGVDIIHNLDIFPWPIKDNVSLMLWSVLTSWSI